MAERSAMKEFNMKDYVKTKTIIRYTIIWDLLAETLKIDQKVYIQDLLESKRMTLCHLTVLPVKASLALFVDQTDDH